MARGKSGGGVSQMQMVRLALEELGPDAKPQEMQAHIKSKHNTELPTTIISNYKSTLRKKSGIGGGRGRRGGGGAIQLQDLEAVRGLVGRLGADQVRKLVDVLA